MHHFFVKQEQVKEKEIVLEGSDVNHLKNVLRVKIAEELLICDEEGKEYTCKIEEIGEEYIKARILWAEESDRELPSKIYLFQGLPKSDKMELIIQKAVELGVYEIIPVATKRCVVKLDAKKADSKVKRWQAISESAAKQAKRSVIPNIHSVLTYRDALEYAKELEGIIIPYELATDMENTRQILNMLSNKKSIGIFIGPEGGFEEDEVLSAKEAGAEEITLGKRILRTETAGLYLLSVLGYLLEGK